MKKPNNYDNVQAGGNYVPVELGGHYALIKQVAEKKSKTGKDMIVIAIDFDKNDKQAEYFSKMFAADNRDDKRWPTQGVKYVLVYAYNTDECSKDFKGFCESVEQSNPGFTINWDADFGSQFKNKKVGVVYGNVESEWQDKVLTKPEIRWFIPLKKVDKAAIPKLKELKQKPATVSSGLGFSSRQLPEDDEVPF